MWTDLYWIETPRPGRVAIMPRPRGGDWLADELAAWRRAGVRTVVSLLTDDEGDELDLREEAEACREAGLNFVPFPVTDRGVPTSPAGWLALVQKLEAELAAGNDVAIHCRAGVGRSAILAASLLVATGVDPDDAFRRIAAARGRPVPDTDVQREWVTTFARNHLTVATRT